MARTYAIADLHGRWDLLEIALSEIEADPPGTVVFLGDYVDRGPESRQIIERLMEGPPAGWRWICLTGNHEQMMVRTLTEGIDPAWWIGNGGAETLRSYGQNADAINQPERVPAEHLVWLRQLPLLHTDKHRVFVHASVDPKRPLDEQDAKTLLWSRYPDDDPGHPYGPLHIVHGHRPYEDGPLCLPGRTDLDTLAYATGRLVVGIFDDDGPAGPVDFIVIEEDQAGDTDGASTEIPPSAP